MKKENGENYKELVVKTMWNTVAKKMQEMYFVKWKIIFDPFKDIIFKSSREARNAKRRNLQTCANKRKCSSASLKLDEYYAMVSLWDENTPAGLQRKFYHIASVELAWRGGEAVNCKVHYFKEEVDNSGMKTGRVEYNPLFNKTAQGGEKKMAESKWLVPNTKNPTFCPVRLIKILMVKRSSRMTTDRLFLTINPSWNKELSSGWYKNTPVRKNELSKWTKEAAEKAGLNTKGIKITNHSIRSTAVSNLAKAGVKALLE
ncbi:uncharacterized protein LOC123680198 [Harmonia axyridis]|uniref:uncharacterized protein LOC123680198 n=1 Tax=Harmonia axyridis TaxID=115357 RepID=UPI001E274FA6|nr:uncharacterized protein LOC123680198 [Harmonia axyridis]